MKAKIIKRIKRNRFGLCVVLTSDRKLPYWLYTITEKMVFGRFKTVKEALQELEYYNNPGRWSNDLSGI